MLEEFKNEDERFAENVRREREKRGWSQAELARRLREFGLEQFHPTTVSRVENGDRPVRLSEAARFANIFETTVSKLVANYTQEIEDLVEALGTMRELESRLVGSYQTYQGARRVLAHEVKVFDDWVASHPEIASDPANNKVIEGLRSTADTLMNRDAWRVLDELESSQADREGGDDGQHQEEA